MSYLFIGVGHAGSSLLDATFHHKNIQNVARSITINSAYNAQVSFKNIHKNNKYVLSESTGFVPASEYISIDEDFSSDPSNANSTATQHYSSLIGILNEHMMSDGDTSTPFAIIFTGLGGTLGCGVAPIIANALDELSGGIVKTIVVGILPVTSDVFSDEIVGIKEAKNCSLAIEQLRKNVNSFILVDNQLIAYAENLESMYPAYNEYIGTSLADLMAGLEDIDKSYPDISLPVINASDIIDVTNLKEPGFAVIGRASVVSRHLVQYFTHVGPHKAIDTLTLASVCAEKLSTNVDIKLAQKNLGLLRVPAYYLKKEKNVIGTRPLEGFLRMNSQNSEHNKMGIALTKRNIVSLTLLFTFAPEDIPRLNEIENVAKEFTVPQDISDAVEDGESTIASSPTTTVLSENAA